MTIDTIMFFEIILSGFITVWTFRYFTRSDKKITEFEWFGSSAFWGLIIVGIIASFKSYPDINGLISNPFAMGLVGSVFGVIIGFVGSKFSKLF